MRPALATALVLSLAACDAPRGASHCDGVRVVSASAPDRRLIGEAADYPADTSLDARWGELTGSQRARRSVAWDAIARVLAPVPLAEPTPLGETSVPRFRTFYDHDDFNRIFQHLYAGLTPAERAARARFDTTAVDDAFVYDTNFLDTLGTWTPERWDAYVASFTTPASVASIGGVGRIAMSPALTRHLAESYPEILRCLADGAPPATVPLAPETERLLRMPLTLEACEERRFGPFFVERGGSLTAHLADPSGAARIAIVEGPSVEAAETRCQGAGSCTAYGPGVLTVRVTSETALDAMLELDRSATVAPTACLDGALPLDAVSVAAEWRRLDPSMPLPVYDTSAARLAAVIATDTPTWGTGERTAMPTEDEIYTQRLPGGETFVLAGFHVRTRELPLGLDITVWWSDQPDADFGADRPASIRALGGPWSHYKMCVAVEHTELDGDPSGGFASEAPSLGDALAAVHEGRGGPTWCSNPYIDAAPGLARGNCVGCHQHAMSGVRPGEIATDSVRFPSSGRLAARNNFPSDGFWGLDAGDDLAAVVQNIVDYWQ